MKRNSKNHSIEELATDILKSSVAAFNEENSPAPPEQRIPKKTIIH